MKIWKVLFMSGTLAAAAIAAGGLATLGGSLFNYKAQSDQLEWQKKQWAQQMAREDTAVQRRAADLELAGLSKTLAAGQAAQTGSAPNVTAPQLDIKAPTAAATAALGLLQQEKDIARTNEQIKLIQDQQAQTQAITAKVPSDIALQKAQSANAYSSANLSGKRAAQTDYDLTWRQISGQGPHPSEMGKTAADLAMALTHEQNKDKFGNIARPAAQKMQNKIETKTIEYSDRNIRRARAYRERSE